MATWAIGDIQGCHEELVQLIDKLRFDPDVDTLWFCGDLVNRGGQSLAVLRTIKSLGASAVVVLGNHDLSLLSIAERKREDQQRVNPELREILFAPDRDELLDWLRRQNLLHVDRSLGFMLVHAGLFPRWTTEQAIEMAAEIEDKLHSDTYRRLMKQLFGNKPDLWTPKLRGIDRWRAGINVFTRMRYCDVRGRISFADKGAPGTQRAGLYPWFEVPGQIRRELRVVCGHWSTLGRFDGLGVHMIDTGCVWGGSLTALRVDSAEPQYVTIKSDRKPAPGKEHD
ncbi:MAG: symmetrical bis(5'-nucleosyl)-tetraphosphatase [Dokdonella sp.]